MARTCRICHHPERDEINRLLADKTPYRTIQALYEIDHASVGRHVTTCIPVQMSRLRANRDRESGIVIDRELNNCFGRINMLLDACHDWLLDPESDGEAYTLEPRATELKVVYLDHGDTDAKGNPKLKKASLDNLIRRIEAADLTVEQVESKNADPRELILKTAGEIRGQLDFYAKLHGLYQKERQNEFDETERRQWVQDKIGETAQRYGLTEPEAIKWLRENTDIPEFAQYQM